MLSNETTALLDEFIGGYGNLTKLGQYRILVVLRLVQKMKAAHISQAIAEIEALKPTV